MNNIITLTQLQQAFPNMPIDQVDVCAFKDVNGDEGERVLHPVVELLKERVVTAVDVVNSWTDDHVFCCLLQLQFEGDQETYFLPLWWFDPTYLLTAGQMVGNLSKGQEFAALFDVE